MDTITVGMLRNLVETMLQQGIKESEPIRLKTSEGKMLNIKHAYNRSFSENTNLHLSEEEPLCDAADFASHEYEA